MGLRRSSSSPRARARDVGAAPAPARSDAAGHEDPPCSQANHGKEGQPGQEPSTVTVGRWSVSQSRLPRPACLPGLDPVTCGSTALGPAAGMELGPTAGWSGAKARDGGWRGTIIAAAGASGGGK